MILESDVAGAGEIFQRSSEFVGGAIWIFASGIPARDVSFVDQLAIEFDTELRALASELKLIPLAGWFLRVL